jgi:FG-GAP repeat
VLAFALMATASVGPHPDSHSQIASVFGASASARSSDFNGDGFDDLGIGAPRETIGFRNYAGAANVLYGSLEGVQAFEPRNQFWHQNSPGVEGESGGNGECGCGEQFGSALAAGDFNGDGVDDLAFGVPQEDIRRYVGGVNVLFGSNVGLQATDPPDQFLNQNSPGIKDITEYYDRFGTSLSAGDFNGDGFDDLAVGVPGENVGIEAWAGATAVLYGSPSGLQGDEPDDQLWTQGSPGVQEDPEAYDSFGSVLFAADYNGDGFADLAIGVPSEDVLEKVDAGAVTLLYGGPGGLQADEPNDQLLTQGSSGVKETVEESDGFGAALGGGDFNGDGYTDLVVGVPSEDLGLGEDQGVAHVLYGGAAGIQASAPDDQLWDQGTPGVEEVPEGGDLFGTSASGSDFNGDGFDDLAVGAPDEDLPGADWAGVTHVLYGSADGLQADAPDDQVWSQDTPDVEDQVEANDRLGESLFAADFNGDGFRDLIIGVPHEGVGFASYDDGAVNVLYGGPAGLQAVDPSDQFWSQDSPGVRSHSSLDLFGASLG